MNPLIYSRIVSIHKGEVKDAIEVISELKQALAIHRTPISTFLEYGVKQLPQLPSLANFQ